VPTGAAPSMRKNSRTKRALRSVFAA
jgi:hypothetical protein